jgi:conjugative transfer region protein TrbK
MDRAAKIAAAAVLGGLLMALAILHPSSPPAFSVTAPDRGGPVARPAAAAVAERCRSVTVADAECAAAWKAKRRHFFGQKD